MTPLVLAFVFSTGLAADAPAKSYGCCAPSDLLCAMHLADGLPRRRWRGTLPSTTSFDLRRRVESVALRGLAVWLSPLRIVRPRG